MPQPELTDTEQETLRTALLGVVELVARRQPGLLARPREELAGSNGLLVAPVWLRDVLLAGGLPAVPPGGPAAVRTAVLAALRDSVRILSSDPVRLAQLRATVLDTIERTAAAVHGVTEAERAEIAEIRAALGVD